MSTDDLTPAESLVDQVLAQQRAKGRATYGKGLDAHDGHDWPMEALSETVDAVQYLAAEVVRLKAALREAADALRNAAAMLRDRDLITGAEQVEADASEAERALRGVP